jgi:hypothetical protein
MVGKVHEEGDRIDTQTNGSVQPDEFDSWNRTEQIKYIGKVWLQREGATSPDETRSGSRW